MGLASVEPINAAYALAEDALDHSAVDGDGDEECKEVSESDNGLQPDDMRVEGRRGTEGGIPCRTTVALKDGADSRSQLEKRQKQTPRELDDDEGGCNGREEKLE